MARRCIHSTRHNHDYARFAARSLSVSPVIALDEGFGLLYPHRTFASSTRQALPHLFITRSQTGVCVGRGRVPQRNTTWRGHPSLCAQTPAISR